MIDTKAAAVSNFQAIKSQIRSQASNAEHVKVDGDSYEVVDHFQVSSPEGDYTVRKGSRFDNDPKTRDNVSVVLAAKDGVQESREFEHYSAKKLIFFSEERLSLKSVVSQQGNGAFFSSSSSVDFSL